MARQQYACCIEACSQCAAACYHCAASCLQESDVKSMARCIALDLDCAAMCEMAAAAMARGSENVQAFCALCTSLCEACDDECVKHAMVHCHECAQACRRCADECRHMVRQGGQAKEASPAVRSH